MGESFRLAVDTGGTFTDLCVVDELSGKLVVTKVPSTPSNPALAVITGIQKLITEKKISADKVKFILHGTTVATNALLEHKGAQTALIITEGFGDVLGYAFDWILEISLILFVYSVMFIFPVLYKGKDLIQMNLIEEVIGPNMTKDLGLIVDGFVLVFLIYLFPHAMSLSLSQTQLLSRGLGIARIYVTLPVSIAVFLTLMVCVSNIIHQTQDLHFGKKEKSNSQD